MNGAVAALTPYLKRYSSALQVTPLSVVLLLFLVGPVIVILIFSFYIFNGFFMEPGFRYRQLRRHFHIVQYVRSVFGHVQNSGYNLGCYFSIRIYT